MAVTRYPTVPETRFGTPEEHLRRVCQALTGVMDGQGNNHNIVTLDPSATSTTLNYTKANINGTVVFSPMSASAAVSFGLGLVWAEILAAGVVTFHHDSSVVTDRRYAVLVNG